MKDDVVKKEEAKKSDQPEGGSELENLKKDFTSLQTRLEEVEAQFKRAVADYHNLERRVAEGRSELASFVGASLITKLFPVLDHLEKALEGASEQEQNSGWYKGVKMAVMQFKQVLKEEGLEEIKTDSKFDPSLHEAVDTKDGDEGKILAVADKGYLLNGKVLRAAKVVVGKKG